MAGADWGPPGFLPGRVHGKLRDAFQAGTHFDIAGGGPALVLIHGVGLDLSMWEPLARLLAPGYTVIRYDMLGHGGSAKPPGPLSLRSFTSQLSEFADYLKLGRFALAGFSMGAMVALDFAKQQPDRIARLCLLNSVFERAPAERKAVAARRRLAERRGPAALANAALERWFTKPWRAANPETVAAVRQRLESNDGQGFLAAYRVFAEADGELRESLNAVTCPVLVVTGSADRGSTPAMARRLAASVARGRAEVLGGLAHMAPVEDPDRIADVLRAFLETEP